MDFPNDSMVVLKGVEYAWTFELGNVIWHANHTFMIPPASVMHMLNRLLLDQQAQQALATWGRRDLSLYLSWLRALGATAQDFENLGLSWLFEPDGEIYWSSHSPLRILGYRVGKSGANEIARREILREAVTGVLPTVGSPEYMASWGMPNTYDRLGRIIGHLRTLLMGPGKPDGDCSQAVVDWNSDIAWLKAEFSKLRD